MASSQKKSTFNNPLINMHTRCIKAATPKEAFDCLQSCIKREVVVKKPVSFSFY